MSVWLFLSFAFCASFFLTWQFRRYALSQSLMDIPNARSSHSVPTPRGGGVAIVLVYLVMLLIAGFEALLASSLVIGLVGAGAVVSVVGFLDDQGHIAARWRLIAHFLAAFWFLAWLPALPRLVIFGANFDLGALGYLLAALMLVWLLNLYNFMDGIDGIASIEAVTVCAGGAILYALNDMPDLQLAPLLLAVSVAGFLILNFPPAKIFMGDTGSGFIGLMLGCLVIHAALAKPQLLWAWLVLLGVFIVDATYTLLRRMLRGDRVYEAHRSHAYQYASREFGRHLPVTLSVLAINLVWLLPWACLIAIGYIDGLVALVVAYIPLTVLAVRFKAGQLEEA